MNNHITLPRSRREFLTQSGAGFGALALAAIQSETNSLAAASSGIATPGPHIRPTAKNVIFLFMEGGPSHLDTFDPKRVLKNKLSVLRSCVFWT
ncbi:MAG TPA: DUF1501 domain-containing protein, partial [Planctomycetaceae bacterium]|nr:DUF1501 domain-containing protein [Planctomycetaceae bacterium]